MRDNPFVKILWIPFMLWDYGLNRLRWKLEELSPGARLRLVVVLIVLFVAVDIYYIVEGFRGEDTTPIEVEHLTPVPLDGTLPDSINLTKTIEHDTIR